MWHNVFMNLSLKQKIIGAVIAIGIILIAIFQMGLGGSFTRINTETNSSTTTEPTIQKISFGEDIELVSTKPDVLMQKKDIVVVPTQVIELTFNKRLENGPETRIVTDPPADFRIELSGDRMTAKLIPLKPYQLGQGYTLFLKGETKFEGGKTLGRDEDFHFTIVDYKGV